MKRGHIKGEYKECIERGHVKYRINGAHKKSV